MGPIQIPIEWGGYYYCLKLEKDGDITKNIHYAVKRASRMSGYKKNKLPRILLDYDPYLSMTLPAFKECINKITKV